MSHGDQVQHVSDEFVSLASTDTCPVAAVKHQTLPVYGLQFHPEVTHTPQGSTLLKNFLYEVCHCTGTWKLSRFRQRSDRANSQAGWRQPRHLRFVRRCRFVGRRGTALQSDRAAAFLHPGRQRLVATKMKRTSVTEEFYESFQNRFACRRQAKDRFLAALGRHRPIRRKNADASGTCSSTVSKPKRKDRGRQVSRPGHAVSRRDRKWSRPGWAGGDDQAASQCRRTCRKNWGLS